MGFREVKAEELQMNPFTTIGKDWLLITAGNEEKCNTMTASWGRSGGNGGSRLRRYHIQPQRYTKEVVDREETFYHLRASGRIPRGAELLRTVSGKGIDKIRGPVLPPVFFDNTWNPGGGYCFVCGKCTMTTSVRSALPRLKMTRMVSSQGLPYRVHCRSGKSLCKRKIRGFAMKEKFIRFMQGRYGVDSLSKFTMGFCSGERHFVSVHRAESESGGTSGFSWTGRHCVYVFPHFSRNIPKRYAENQKFLGMTAGIRSRFNRKEPDESGKNTSYLYVPGMRSKIRDSQRQRKN